MQIQKLISLGIILTLFSTVALAQERKVIQVRRGVPSDSIKAEVYFDHDFKMSDSIMKNVFIHKLPHHAKKAARIIIKKSGFFRKSKIIIDFDPHTKEIVSVVDNEKEVAPGKFHKYQDYLEDAADMEELEALHPKMEELEWTVEAPHLPDSEKIANLESMILNLELLESDHAKLKREHYLSQVKIIKLDELTEIIQSVLEESGVTPPQKIKSLKVSDGKFFLNGEEITGEAGQKCLEAWNSHSGHENISDSDEEVTIEIKFD